MKLAYEHLRPKKDKNGITISPDGTVQIGGTPQPLTKTNKNNVQKSMVSATESLQRLKEIKSNYDPEFLTYGGRVKNLMSKVKDKAGLDLSEKDEAALKQRRKFTQDVNREFNAYRKLITGAAAAMAELESLKKAIINEDLSPTEFEAAFDQYAGELERTTKIGEGLMAEGLKPGTAEFGIRMDEEFKKGRSTQEESRSNDDIMAQYGL